ncbi:MULTISPECIES: nicotinate-nucleotide adenylyltransferase [Aerococcus]|uniref:Probable nicotinate-nucleotide adenylyltransferase n=1 Tax=Aerococcus viridans TaxID=1377 RepID=A0A2N6UBL9_9LACT|nr:MULTISPECIES: nicotinate-nucleotide adenylyltransferase [Aerococcus]OFU51337.1 nicotinate-nicotinamide nucleotide adenylyltransferase [Aerococcus sp. HMSC10H05]PMC78962.1 nicotinate-nucleotide adenylyltransferase [Aerococcus viridans]
MAKVSFLNQEHVRLINDPETELAFEDNPHKRIGILGGTFNPIHNGHLLMAEQVYDKLKLDEVWFMPNKKPPHAESKETLADAYRVDMIALAIEDNPHFRLEGIELDRVGKSYTVDTMEILTTLYPTYEFYFIIGADMIEDLPKWHRINDLIKMVHFVGVGREGYRNETDYPLIFIDAERMTVSSTSIRKAVAEQASIRYLTPASVAAYILEKGLYQPHES